MIRITVKYPDGYTRESEAEAGITPQQLAERHPEHCPYQVLACSVNNVSERLTAALKEDCRLELLDMRSPYGNMCYQSSLSLIYLEAVHHVFGKDTRVTIANSLSKGLFTVIHSPGISDESIRKVSERMKKTVSADMMISEKRINRQEMLDYLKGDKDSEEYRLVDTAADLQEGLLVQAGEESGLSYCHLVPSAG